MKYKLGDKFLVEITEINDSGYPYTLNEIGIITTEENTEENLDKLRKPDDMTAEEAWNIAKKIILNPGIDGYTTPELGEIFGTPSIIEIFRDNTIPQQAKAKIEAWEAKKEIKVGDEITAKDDDGNVLKLFVQKITRDNRIKYWGIINHDDGTADVGFISHGNDVKKTGRHVDIQSVIEQIGGEE